MTDEEEFMLDERASVMGPDSALQSQHDILLAFRYAM